MYNTDSKPKPPSLTKAGLIELAEKNRLGSTMHYFDYAMSYLRLNDYVEEYLEHNSLEEILLHLHPTYHNVFHTKIVVLSALEGALRSGYAVEDKMVRVLCTAALFHDANHRQGEPVKGVYERFNDVYNIECAIEMFNRAQLVLAEKKSKQLLNNDQAQEVRELIRCTQYPYRPRQSVSEIGKILLDADMMTIYCEDEKLRTALMLGLCNESSKRIPTSYKEFYEKQQVFARSVKWNTKWAENKAFQHNWLKLSRELIFHKD